MDYRDLASEILKAARATGADAADLLVSEGTEFSVTVRKGEVETLTEAGSKALGLRVFVGKRTASTYTSDFSWPTLARLIDEVVGMARATSEDAAAGLADEVVPPEDVELGLYDPSSLELPPSERIERARRAEAAALETPGIVNSQGASWGSGEGSMLLATSAGFMGGYRTSSVSLSVVPQAERDGQMERDHWYTAGRGLADLESPEQVGRTAAERTLRRLGARQVKTAEVPVVFDPESASEILGTLFSAISGYAVFRNATFLKDRLGQEIASPLVTLVDDGRRPRDAHPRGDPRLGRARALRHRPDRLRGERGDRGLLAGRRRSLDRGRAPDAPGPRDHDRGEPARDAEGRGRGRKRPRVPRRLRVAHDPDPQDDGERRLATSFRRRRACGCGPRAP